MSDGAGKTTGSEYLTDVEYTDGFYQCLAPSWLAYIAAINGCQPPRLDGSFKFCELGCGKGLTTLVLAATHPGGEFHAYDLNPVHVRYARNLREAAGVANARFHSRSFREMLAAPLPRFDFIAMHGVYSWVSDTVRAEILELVRRFLRPGGLFMVSYNAMPGFAHLLPIRRMMRACAATLPGTSLEKARAAFRYVSALAEGGALYFETVPAAAAQVKRMAREDIRHVAHEYLTPHGDAFYFGEVEEAMRKAGLAFAGSMLPRLNYAELMLPPQFAGMLRDAGSRSALETHRDFFVNTAFRQDLYVAQPVVAAPGRLPLERLSCVRYCLTDLPERLALAQAEGPLEFDLRGRAHAVRAVHSLLERGPAEVEEVHRASGLPERDETSALVQQLVVANHVAPAPPVGVAPGWMRLDSALLEAAVREHAQQVALACPLAGSASMSEVVHATAIQAAARCDDAVQAAASALALLRSNGYPVNRQDATGTTRCATDAEVLEYVAATWRRLRDPASADGRLLRLFGLLP